jgi:ribosome biogenesis GTPase A
VLDTPGVLVPSIPDMETGLKLALTGYTSNKCFPVTLILSNNMHPLRLEPTRLIMALMFF